MSRTTLSLKKAFSLFCVGVVAFLSSCQDVGQKSIGDTVSGPYALAKIPTASEIMVLNSSTSGEFKDGSLARYSIETNGKLSLKSSLSIPRLGFSLAVSEDGKFAAVSFVGSESVLRFYSLANDGLSEIPEFTLPLESNSILENLKFFKPDNVPDHYLLGSLTSGKVFIYKISETASEKVFTLPDDMPKAEVLVDRIAYGAPVYVKSQNLLIAFPLNTGYEIRPRDANGFISPHMVATGQWNPLATGTTAGDVRGVSMVAVDFEKFLSEKSLRNAIAYVPFIHRDDYKLPTTSESPDDSKPADKENPQNTARYRRAFQNAVYLNETGCLTRHGGTLPADTVLVSEDPSDGYSGPRGQMIALSGWTTLKTKITALPVVASESEFDSRKRLIFQNVNLKLFSNAEGLLVPSSRTTPIQVLEKDGVCQPVWARIETGRTLGGMEKSTLVTQVGDATQAAKESSNQLLSRGTMGLAAGDGFIFTSSYSFDVLSTALFEENEFKLVP